MDLGSVCGLDAERLRDGFGQSAVLRHREHGTETHAALLQRRGVAQATGEGLQVRRDSPKHDHNTYYNHKKCFAS